VLFAVAEGIAQQRREIDLLPSLPRSAPPSPSGLTKPLVMSVDVTVSTTGCGHGANRQRSSWTVSPATTVLVLRATVKVGAVTLVMSSLLETPESDDGASTGVPPVGPTAFSV